MPSNGNQDSESLTWPDEKTSRREGWTEGPAVPLYDGNPWHLPKLDASLIQHLPELRLAASAVELYRLRGEAAEASSDGLGTIYDEVFFAAFKGFFALAIHLQYEVGTTVLSNLIDGGFLGDRQPFNTYFADFLEFARRFPTSPSQLHGRGVN